MEKEKINDFEELRFSKYFFANAAQEFRKFYIISKEYQLYPALRVIQKQSLIKEDKQFKPFGRIDFVVKYKKKTYVVEVKYNEGTHSSFWDALKVVGYDKYYEFQADTRDVIPAIFMPKESIKLEHEFVCLKLGIKLFDITKTRDGSYKLEEHNNEPNW